MDELTEQEAMKIVMEAHPQAVLVEGVSHASGVKSDNHVRKEYTIRDSKTWTTLGPTSITTAARAWIYAAVRIKEGR